MRVLLVSTGYPPDGLWGTETYTRGLARGLTARGHEVVVFYPVRAGREPGAEQAARAAAARDGVRLVPATRALPRSKRLVDSYQAPDVERAFQTVLRGWRPDRVHFLHLLWSLSLALPRLARQAGVPSVLTLTDLGLLCHRGQMRDHRLRDCGGAASAERCARCIREPGPFDGAPLELSLKRAAVRAIARLGGLGRVVTARDVELRAAAVARALSSVDRLIAPTEAMAGAFTRAGYGPIDRLVYSLDDSALRAARAEPREPTARIRFFGQLAPHKGALTLVRAAEHLAERCGELDWSVHLHGAPGPSRHRTYARQLARSAGDRVRIERPFSPAQLTEVLAGTSILVLPSEWMENAPLTALQARAAAVPIVASDVPGLREVVEPGRHGWLFPAGDARALAERIEPLLRGGIRRLPGSRLPLSMHEHLERLTAIYAGLEAATPAVVGA